MSTVTRAEVLASWGFEEHQINYCKLRLDSQDFQALIQKIQQGPPEAFKKREGRFGLMHTTSAEQKKIKHITNIVFVEHQENRTSYTNV